MPPAGTCGCRLGIRGGPTSRPWVSWEATALPWIRRRSRACSRLVFEPAQVPRTSAVCSQSSSPSGARTTTSG
eukprot:6686734-Alexandrium_andersonii.AAC.1